MKAFEVRIGPGVRRDLRRIQRAGRSDIVNRILAALALLEEDPIKARPGLDVQELEAAPRGRIYRWRVGGYRVLYEVDFERRRVMVTTVFHRSRGYRF